MANTHHSRKFYLLQCINLGTSIYTVQYTAGEMGVSFSWITSGLSTADVDMVHISLAS